MANTPTTWPLKGATGIITTHFGWTTNPFTKVGYMHTGVDIAWGIGTPIVATADGTVAPDGATPRTWAVLSSSSTSTVFTLATRIWARSTGKHKGDHVNRGDVIGYIGMTGLTTGPHLHYEVRLGAQYVDPMMFLSIAARECLQLEVSGRSSD